MNNLFDLGLIAMSAKPYHIGHDFLIKQASNMCSYVNVYVSTTDRKRKGELTISGADMKLIWEEFLINNMPDNVSVELDSSSPIRKLYNKLLEIENEKETKIAIFSDANDKIKCDLSNVSHITFERDIESPNISGKIMRQFIASNDFDSFKNYLPQYLDQSQKESMFNLLKPNSLQFIQVF